MPIIIPAIKVNEISSPASPFPSDASSIVFNGEFYTAYVPGDDLPPQALSEPPVEPPNWVEFRLGMMTNAGFDILPVLQG